MSDPHPCGDPGFNCSKINKVCKLGWEGPNSGITNFDNFGLAMLTVLRISLFLQKLSNLLNEFSRSSSVLLWRAGLTFYIT